MPATKKTLMRERDRQRYLAKKKQVLLAKRKEPAKSQAERNEAKRARYATNPEPRKSESRARYAANSEQCKSAFKARYRANTVVCKAASTSHYRANTAACKSAFASHYRANMAAFKSAFVSRYRANTAACKAAFASRYKANTAACKAVSTARYRAYTASYKAAFKSRYRANRDVYKVAFRTRYEANAAACKAASKATYQSKREQVRSVYLLDSAWNRVACAKRYACMGTKIRAQRRGRYVLREPNDDVKLQYVTELKCKLIANSKVRASLKRVFAATHADVALNMSQTGLTIAAYRLASQSVLTKALKERKYSAGKLLGAIANINELSITCDELGGTRAMVRRQNRTFTKWLMHLSSDSLPLQWTTVADALLRKRFSIKTGTRLNDHCGSVRKNASIPLRMRLLAFAASKPCLNSLCNRCARVLKTSTLAVHICTARCH